MNCEIRSNCLTSDRARNGHAGWKRRSGWSGAGKVAGVFVGDFTQPVSESPGDFICPFGFDSPRTIPFDEHYLAPHGFTSAQRQPEFGSPKLQNTNRLAQGLLRIGPTQSRNRSRSPRKTFILNPSSDAPSGGVADPESFSQSQGWQAAGPAGRRPSRRKPRKGSRGGEPRSSGRGQTSGH